MDVYVPWRRQYLPLHHKQYKHVERDDDGYFLYVFHLGTNLFRKCRVRSRAAVRHTLLDLVGRRLRGIVARRDDYVAILVEEIDGVSRSCLDVHLFDLSKNYLAMKRWSMKVVPPLSWTQNVPTYGSLGPHVSLHPQHVVDIHKEVELKIVGVSYKEANSGWVLLDLEGPFDDPDFFGLHMSCAQRLF